MYPKDICFWYLYFEKVQGTNISKLFVKKLSNYNYACLKDGCMLK